MLTAGLGTRLKPLSLVRAKAAVPIAGQPLVTRILRWLGASDVRHVVLNLHHLPETITRQVGDGSQVGVQVRYSWECPVLGSAGGPRKALSMLPDEDFFIINGDTITNVDLIALEAAHRESGALVTLAVMKHKWPGRYGSIITDARGFYYGTMPAAASAAGYHFVGVQMAHPSVFASLPLNHPSDTLTGVYRELAAEKRGSVRAFLCDPIFLDVGTPADYLDAALSVARAEGKAAVDVGRNSRIDRSAHVVDTILWDEVDVGAGATLERCIVADGVVIPAGASFRNCAIVQREGDLIVADVSHG